MNFATFTTARSTLSSLALGTALFAAGLPTADALTLDFSSIPKANITFTGTGDTVTFPTTVSGKGFQITASDGFGDSMGLYGAIGGSFKIGGVTTTETPVGQIQNAKIIAGSGTLSIWDLAGEQFSADLTFATISTLGRAGGLDADAVGLNLTNFSYSGHNQDLRALLNDGVATQVMTFQFGSPKSLTFLKVDGKVTTTSYSGTISAVPIPAAAWLFGSALVGLVGFGRRSQPSQKKDIAA